jgi:hypothetical protein
VTLPEAAGSTIGQVADVPRRAVACRGSAQVGLVEARVGAAAEQDDDGEAQDPETGTESVHAT